MMKGLQVISLSIILRSIITQASSSNVFRSKYGSYLKGHVFKTMSVPGLQQCSMSCLHNTNCKSSNFNFVNKTCELNDADQFDNPGDLVPIDGFSYSGWKYRETEKKSCAEIKAANAASSSGYYIVSVRRKRRKVYCDMDKFGGGWTLIASISAKNNNHLQSSENNCESSPLCVKYSTSNITSRKLSDEDIIAFASTEGTFRIDKLGSDPVTNFHQFPGGKEQFSSSCYHRECGRFIISHYYPYMWESNCRGIHVGYYTMYYVFDSHDDGECINDAGSRYFWYSSLHPSGRTLYGYKGNENTGLFFKREGHMYVK